MPPKRKLPAPNKYRLRKRQPDRDVPATPLPPAPTPVTPSPTTPSPAAPAPSPAAPSSAVPAPASACVSGVASSFAVAPISIASGSVPAPVQSTEAPPALEVSTTALTTPVSYEEILDLANEDTLEHFLNLGNFTAESGPFSASNLSDWTRSFGSEVPHLLQEPACPGRSGTPEEQSAEPKQSTDLAISVAIELPVDPLKHVASDQPASSQECGSMHEPVDLTDYSSCIQLTNPHQSTVACEPLSQEDTTVTEASIVLSSGVIKPTDPQESTVTTESTRQLESTIVESFDADPTSLIDTNDLPEPRRLSIDQPMPANGYKTSVQPENQASEPCPRKGSGPIRDVRDAHLLEGTSLTSP